MISFFQKQVAWEIQLTQALPGWWKHCSGSSKYLSILGHNPGLFSLPFYFFFLDYLSHFQSPNYHLYANDYQIYISNPLLSSEFQFGTSNSLICIYFECLTDNSNWTCQKSNS
jgi:hypothetical protein